MTFMVAAAIGGGASILGGLIGSKGASRAAQTQANAATEAARIQAAQSDKTIALQERMYNEQIARNQPYVGAGALAQNRLLSMLGLQADPRYAGSRAVNSLAPSQSVTSSVPAPTMLTRDQLRQQLLPQFTTPATQGQWVPGVGEDQIGAGYFGATPASVNEAALNAEIDRLYGQQQAQQQQWQANQAQAGQVGTIPGEDPYYGMYANGYQAAPDLMVGNYQDPGDFTMEKFQQDPGYAFRMSEGLKALDRTAAARGGLISGSALKAASRYGQDMASQEYQNAFNRYNQNRTFNSNLFNANRAYQTGQYNTNRNFNTDLYQTNRSNALAPLGTLMASGQNAANQMGAAGQNYAGNAGTTYQQAGNAAAAGINAAGQAGAAGQMGVANSLNNAINTAASSYNQANLLNALRGSTPATDSGWGNTFLYGRE